MVRHLFVVSLALAAAGCAGGGFGGGLEPPEVTLSDIEFVGAGLFEQRLGLVLRMRNPNKEDLPLDGMRLRLEIDDKPFASGMTNQDVTIPGLGEETVTVEAVSATTDVLSQLRRMTGFQDIDYTLAGTAFLRGSGERRLPFEQDGSVRLSGLGQ